jgi:glycerol-3-phosphate O-acyltransferase
MSQKYLYRLIRAHRTSSRPISVVPLLLVWERRPDQKNRTILEDIFGTTQNPGFFRKVLFWFQAGWQSFLRFGAPLVQVSTPIEIGAFLREYPGADSADASELLRERLSEYFERERRVILGPTGEASRDLWTEVRERPEIQDAIRRVARIENVAEGDIAERAKDQFEEIAAEPNLMVLKVLSALLSIVWYRIYDGFEVDEEGLERLREASRDSSIVLIPSHKSHVDYLIISYLFYKYGLNPPAIAAGVNLSFWPMGWIFRRCGAFFIRRSFRGEELYPVVFREYLIRIMEEGYPIEFFIEGTRSRTGKLIKPKYGMLDMIVRAYVSGRLEDVKLVPISVGYEKVIEEGSHKQELLGGEKEKESLSGLLKTPKFLTSRYGRLYIEFDEPVSVGEYFEKYDLERLAPEEQALDAMVVRLAHRIIYDINQVTTVTPAALASMVLLTNDARGIDRLRFQREVGFLIHCLKQPNRDLRLSRTIRDSLSARSSAVDSALERRREEQPVGDVTGEEKPELDAVPLLRKTSGPNVETLLGDAVSVALDEALRLFVNNDQVKIERTDGDTVYSVPEDSRLGLNYYRNSILHHFVPEALLAAAVGRFSTPSIPLEELMSETLFLSRMFKYEWIYEERAEFENVFMRTLRYFEACGWIARPEPDVVWVELPRPPELEFFRRNVLSYLEGYALVARNLALMTESVSRKEVTGKLLGQARADYLRGDLIYQESLSKPTYENALRLFGDWGVLEREFDASKKREYLKLTDEWSDEQIRGELLEHIERFVIR